MFRTFSLTTQRQFIVAEFEEQEIILRMGLHLFHIHHFCVQQIPKYLIAKGLELLGVEKLAKTSSCLCRLLNIRVFVAHQSDLYERNAK